MRTEALELLELADWKRIVAELYAAVRSEADPAVAWRRWRAARDRLFAEHPQSPLPPNARTSFDGLSYFDYEPGLRVFASVEPAAPERLEIPTSTGGRYAFTRFAIARFEAGGGPASLEVFWLEGYGGGVFVSFRDATSGHESYGPCRYLLDTVKGADLGMAGERLVLDFNFAYNPSCAYDARWTCPLAPPANRLAFAVRAGERAPGLDAERDARPS
jgi:uncharacterized protein (DUF1684 family)